MGRLASTGSNDRIKTLPSTKILIEDGALISDRRESGKR